MTYTLFVKLHKKNKELMAGVLFLQNLNPYQNNM